MAEVWFMLLTGFGNEPEPCEPTVLKGARTMATRSDPASFYSIPSEPANVPPDIVRRLFRLGRQLHRPTPIPGGPLRVLMEGICQILNASRGSITLSHMHPDTGEREIVLSLSVFAGRPRGVGRRRPSFAAADGPGLDSFVSIDGIRRVSSITLWRTDRMAKFSPAERSLVDLIHAESIWMYDAGEALPKLKRSEASAKTTAVGISGSRRKLPLEMPGAQQPRAQDLRARSA